MKEKKTILITGVAGLLGSRLADWIVENKPEYNIIGIDDLSGGFEENIRVAKQQISLMDSKIFREAVLNGGVGPGK